jgi:hypothetical protein
MKLVFNIEEVAAALGKTPEEFKVIRPELEVLGFPTPIRGLEDKWSIMNVISWVNATKEAQFEAA